jgi:DNA-directed RNA polymerase subunit H (RpoH/RPB5)
MLYDKVNKEIEDIDNKDSINLKKEKINIILFKNRNNDPEEIKNAIICNLFFDIKWKLEDEFNNHIHNTTHSIITLLSNEIKQLENNDNEDGDLDDSTNTKEEIKDDLSIKEKIPSENINIIRDTICPKKYAFIEKLENDIQVNKKDVKKFEEILQTDENDFIIPSNVGEFFKALKDIEISHDTLPSIKIEDSLDLYLNGKKGKILKKNLPDQKIKNIIKGYDKLSKEDKNEIIKIKNFCDKIKDQIENVSISLCYFMDNIIDEIEKISQFFDIKLLIKKYKIKEPLNPLLNIIRLNYKTNDEPTEEIYFLLLILSYFFISSKIKEMNKIKNDFEKINIDEIIKNNILKRNIINKIIQNLSDLSMDSLLPNIWEKIKDCKKFTDDEEMNKLMVEYVENKSIEDFRNDLVNLIKPFYEEFNLTGKDQ